VKEQEWIKIEEDCLLPEFGEDVLCYDLHTNYRHFFVADLKRVTESRTADDSSTELEWHSIDNEYPTPTHWMPVPDKPSDAKKPKEADS